MVVRIAVNVLRASVLLALILGILFWTGNATSLVLVHMGLGILAVLLLVGLAAIGLGEMIAGRYRRVTAAAAA